MKHCWILPGITTLLLATSPAWADAYLDQATAAVAKATASSTQWDGPTSGPQLQANKKIIFIASDMKNGGVQGVQQGLSEAAKVAGWQLETLDGGGSVKDQLSSLNQAIAQKPDGIVIGGWNPNVAKIPLKKAVAQGIVLTAWHAVPEPGPIAKYDVFYNVTSDSNEVARIAAQYAVVKSDGQANVLIFTDSLYQIALDKANVMKEEVAKCSGCKLVEFIDTPLADTASRMPAMTFSLLQKYGDKFQYALAINDLYFDFMAPALKTAGKGGSNAPFNISAGDGSISAYQRIRSGDSQSATVPEPLKLHGWQLLDEFNRAFAKQAPSGYVTPAHLVTRENIANDGGPNNMYDPQNDYQGHYKTIWGVK
ncbi:MULTISPECIES: substrate-binding domain-containing protein [Serratia]|uniref:ABC transporter substrate-binding protein n=1 Tax=Serratia TaxID=613 RepID=UPI000420D323|nr:MULTISPECIES: substrate-binding domain-containing protein [Serratia]ATM78406.1 sugar ABC transporter substrate-binding protein [Serratia fonticola]MBC3218995.1 substrate-binding domain-containing protein [Serratia fonticola]MBE0148467.1 substrate-binding domain-containing protein [Serratia fonticola]MDQ7207880.1 substrate-binding domain-containing protein [Serratia fonticola]NBJ36784.1 substrate-binding domain-containing protein [Serratia fonticola]